MNRSVRRLPPLPFPFTALAALSCFSAHPAFAGNVTEHKTRARMLTGHDAPEGAVVIIGRGISTKDNPRWLSNTPYRDLMISRTMKRVFDADETRAIAIASRDRFTV